MSLAICLFRSRAIGSVALEFVPCTPGFLPCALHLVQAVVGEPTSELGVEVSGPSPHPQESRYPREARCGASFVLAFPLFCDGFDRLAWPIFVSGCPQPDGGFGGSDSGSARGGPSSAER